MSKDGDKVSVSQHNANSIVLKNANYSGKFVKNRRIPSGDIELVLGF